MNVVNVVYYLMLGLFDEHGSMNATKSSGSCGGWVAWKDKRFAPENSGPCHAVVGNVEM